MTITPITDENERLIYSEGNYGMGEEYAERVVDSEVCRKLELDRAALLEALRDIASCSEYEAHKIARETLNNFPD